MIWGTVLVLSACLPCVRRTITTRIRKEEHHARRPVEERDHQEHDGGASFTAAKFLAPVVTRSSGDRVPPLPTSTRDASARMHRGA
jgi:hypothetical protein